MDSNSESNQKMDEPSDAPSINTEFKKPVLIGRIGKLPKKVKNAAETTAEVKNECTPEPEDQSKKKDLPPKQQKSSLPPAVLLKEMSTPIPYKEPKWSGLCPDGSSYSLEVIKSGLIVETIDLTQKPYHVFGRLANCDVVMAHPTISRHHTVIQYKAFAEAEEPPAGWYAYDLGSTHGTFLNRERLQPRHYTRLRVGHQIKFGSSSRTYCLLGPDFDCEGESELTVTEIKQRAKDMKLERDKLIKEAIEKREMEKAEAERKREEQGIDWGMGEDAEDEPDLTDNPFAVTTNEELYLQDPKKTLRGYFEREGLELTYNCEERGVGQFVCSVELPIDDANGRPLTASVTHKGRKKDAVVACALDACRALDRAGVLRQSRHEPRRARRAASSDSDDDTYWDRTGGVERRRARRQRPGAAAVGHDELVEQAASIEGQIASCERELARLRGAPAAAPAAARGGGGQGGGGQGGGGQGSGAQGGGDSLDEFMSSLSAGSLTMARKAEISNAKMRLATLRGELSSVRRLAALARPALPPVTGAAGPGGAAGPAGDAGTVGAAGGCGVTRAAGGAVYGKRIKLKGDQGRPCKARRHSTKQDDTQFVEEVDSDEDSEKRKEVDDKQEDIGEERIPEHDSTKTEKVPAETMEHTEETVHTVAETKGTSVQEVKKVFGPMRPPDDYVIPEGYFDQGSERDVAEIMEDDT